MHAKIFQPSRSSMSSGLGNTRKWVLEFNRSAKREIDPLMGWTSSNDMQTQVRLEFDSLEDARDYAKSNGFTISETQPHPRKTNVRAGGYGENFATNRRTVWTH